jgi:hypothetical protein
MVELKPMSEEEVQTAYAIAGRGTSSDAPETVMLRKLLADVLDDREYRLSRASLLRDQAVRTAERRAKERDYLQAAIRWDQEATVVGRALLALQSQLERVRTVKCKTRTFDWTPAGMVQEVRNELNELEVEQAGSMLAQGEALDVFCVAMNQLKTHGVSLFQGLLAAEKKLRERCDKVEQGGVWKDIHQNDTCCSHFTKT